MSLTRWLIDSTWSYGVTAGAPRVLCESHYRGLGNSLGDVVFRYHASALFLHLGWLGKDLWVTPTEGLGCHDTLVSAGNHAGTGIGYAGRLLLIKA